jgi:hypothetical protein
MGVRQVPLPRVIFPLRLVEVIGWSAGVPRTRQRVSQEPASSSLDTADYVAPDRPTSRVCLAPASRIKRIYAKP